MSTQIYRRSVLLKKDSCHTEKIADYVSLTTWYSNLFLIVAHIIQIYSWRVIHS